MLTGFGTSTGHQRNTGPGYRRLVHFEPSATCETVSSVQSQGESHFLSLDSYSHSFSLREVRKSIELKIAGTVPLRELAFFSACLRKLFCGPAGFYE